MEEQPADPPTTTEPPGPTPYANPPQPGTYLIASRVVPGNCIEVHPNNESRAVCSSDGSDRQLWHVQRFGKGYKIKSAAHSVYLSVPDSRLGSVIETSTQPTMWNLVRTHDGFAIQYGEEDGIIDLHYCHQEWASMLCIVPLETCQWSGRRWNFVHKSDDVGGEVAETVEDQVEHLRNVVAVKDAEIAALSRQVTEQQRELQELRRDRQGEPNTNNAR
ncbi:hypothetical protein RSOLAG22IIIB_00402 [Rhizoctonia solani]|uniref:Ricin B lectin domain-containing protein n=1 Tax=Rhizoctonia solani TaxID=456999 RepID=A0A0K6FVM7_9AGAM|nr:hypothetical protein RSOLAG22IIIB_00402 [Rhizoctonia solani]